MRIAVLAHSLRSGGGLSLGLNMIDALGQAAAGGHDFLFVVHRDVGYEQVIARIPRARSVLFFHRGLAQRFLYDRFPLAREVAAFEPDVILALNGRGLSQPPCAQALFPQIPYFFYSRRHYGRIPVCELVEVLARRADLRRQLKRAALVLVQTRVMQRRLHEVLGYRGASLVCGSGLSASFAQLPVSPAFPAQFEAWRDGFRLFAPARYMPHKNLEILVELFANHRAALHGVVVFLTIRPDHHPNAPRLLRQIERAGLTRQIVNLGTVPHDQIPAFYAHSHGMIAPTLMETMGLTYLEAMRSSCPILTSNLDFAHEVCGEAATYFDPWRADSIRDAVAALRQDAARRERLVELGRRRLTGEFQSWQQIAGNVLDRLQTIGAA